MDREFAELFEQYIKKYRPRGPFPMRPIPVNRAVGLDRTVSPYDDIKALIQRQDRIAVAKCFCCAHTNMVSNQCDQPLEVCFMFDFYADYYVENGWARWVSSEESIEILTRCEEFGLVCQPVNLKNPSCICNCCPTCCKPFQALKMHPKPVEIMHSNYFAQVESKRCSACETCLDRCPIGALTMDDVAVVNLDRCIGCGLCTVSCPTEALQLREKQKDFLKEPLDTIPFMKPGAEFEREMH